MLIEARCTAVAYDSLTGVMYRPGQGDKADGRYLIESTGQLARLKVGSRYVFDFDRNPSVTASGELVAAKDYSCDRCGAKFKTLHEHGRHFRWAHTNKPFLDGTEDEPIVKPPDGRRRPRTYNCKFCAEFIPSLYHYRKHLEQHKAAETTAIPA